MPNRGITPSIGAERRTIAATVGAGWAGNDDWYYQDPVTAPADQRTVNAGTAVVGLDFALDVGVFRVGAGVHGLATLGAHHATKYGGDKETRVLTYPHLAIGITWVQITAGYLFPHHIGLGAQATIPVWKGLELRGSFLWGLNPSTPPAEGTWTASDLVTAWGGMGYRFSF